jgi:hypothetical protein
MHCYFRAFHERDALSWLLVLVVAEPDTVQDVGVVLVGVQCCVEIR